MSDKKQYERAKKLFQIARKMEPSERDKFLNNECQSDESLLIEVKSLLDFDSPETLISKPLKHDETLAHLSDVTIRKANETRFLSKHLDSTTIIKLFKDRSRKRLLVIGLVSLFVFGLGFLLHQTIEFALKRNLQEGLQAILNADVEGVKEGLNEIKLVVSNMAEEKAFQQSIQQINKFAKDNRLSKDISKQIRDIYPFETTLNRLLVVLRGENYFVVNRTGQFLISNDDKKVGQYLPQEQLSQMSPVFQGESKVIFPKPDKSQLENRTAPNIWGLAPVRDAEDKIIAVLCIGISTDAKFFKLLKIARLGKTGETYAFNKEGYLISESRFTEQLKEIGMIPNKPDSKAIFRVQVRDPGGDLTAGYEPDVQMEARPLTVMAASAIEGKTDFNGEGYRDYRGVTVIGVWTWIPEYSIGITTEVDYTEAYKPLVPVTWLFWLAAIGMTGVVIGLVLSVMRIDKLEHNLEDLQQLGAYVLEEKIGEGGMGVVYKAKHSLLARPTAIKILKQEELTEESIARFEREVRLACQLMHPNTIKIYDFGKSDDSLFYYAMEFLPGITLADMVEKDGPQASQHVIDILIQICKSLHEAHSIGLVHRDIKPRNIMLCDRWGETNVIKVLDFGLAKMVEHSVKNDITSEAVLAGTPQYVAPERFHEPTISDPRSDIFSLGAVAYELVTGRKAFDGNQLMDIISKILKEDPAPIENQDTPEELKALIFQCLEKEMDDRPQSVDEIINRLNNIHV